MDLNNQIIIYQTEDGQTQVDVRLENETVWLTQAQMVELFQTTKQNVSLHVGNVFKEGELEQESTVKEYLTVQKEGERNVSRKVKYYNLDVIISVGYRVKSNRGTAFRIWARKILKDYLIKGYAVNERLRKEQIGELRQLVGMLGRTIQSQPLLSNDETNALFEVVTDYTYALDTLDNYDYERLTINKTTKKSHSMPLTRMQWRLSTACVKNSEVLFSLATRRTDPSKAVSDRYTRPLTVKNSIPAWRRKPPCCSISSPRTTRSATVTNVSPPRSSFGSLTIITFSIILTVASALPTVPSLPSR